MSLEPPEKVGKLQAALHGKAKAEPGYRFYLLYDKIHRRDVLAHAYACCRENRGAAGVDGETFKQIEAYGVERWLGELAQALRKRTYKPQALRRVWIPKPGGRERPLGIPTVRDRVVQRAAVLVLGPIFEADLPSEQYAYRKGRGALDAVDAVNQWLHQGCPEVVDADLSGYFDAIPHAELMKSVARRVSDRHVLHLVKMWLECPVEETDERGRTHRTTRNKDDGRGTPQGGVISPLLANLYMRRFVRGWKRLGHERRLGAHIVNYADDLVICCPPGRADAARGSMRRMMSVLRLTVNERKTRLCHLPEGQFDFLGYTFARQYSRRTGRPYIGPKPSKKSLRRLCAEVRAVTQRSTAWRDVGSVVGQLNVMLRGWAGYFRRGTVVHAYETVMQIARRRLRRWLCVKHKVRRGGHGRYPDRHLHEQLGLALLPGCTHSSPCATP